MKILNEKSFSIFALVIVLSLVSSCSADTDLSMADHMPEAHRSATFVSLGDALKNADAVLSALRNGTTRGTSKVKSVEMLWPNKRSERRDEMNGFYLVNYENNAGFALLSADNRRPSVYAISEVGSLHLSDTLQNKSLSFYLNDFLPNISAPAATEIGPILPPGPIADSATIEYEFCSPVIKGFLSKFDQTAPFNKYCFDKNGKSAYIGCGPLAVATIMGYYKWPNKIESYEFDWTAMHSNMNDDRWYRLFEVLGRTQYLNATYGEVYNSDGTNIYIYNIPGTFAKCGYKTPMRISLNLDILKSEIEKSRPVVLRGGRLNNRNEETGHIWIVDGGYDAITTYLKTNAKKCDTYYHIVWGWGGDNNGYFLFNPNNLIVGGTAVKPDNDVTDNTDVYDRNFDLIYGFEPINK